MNILASYKWLKEYMKADLSPQDFARELSLRSMAVERIEDLKESYANMVVGLVQEVKEHPNADKLKIAVTDIGSKDVEIVCGGINLKEGMRVFVALPGSKVRWHGEGDLVELKETEIRGAKSFGMICAASEVGFEKVAEKDREIWDLSDVTQAQPGTPIVEAFDIDDVIFDIEITTNRPECMGILGLAREGAAATESDFLFTPPALPEGKIEKPLEVQVQDKDLCPRYMAVVIDGVKVGPSPLWLQMKLLKAGHRPINNIVDISNYVLHEYGQPMHAFDYEKLAGGKIIVRRAKAGETIKALDDNDYELSPDRLVIADVEKPVAVAGVMGGKESGTWDGTQTIVFEAAAFDAVSVRKTSRALNLYSDSQLLFEKGLSTEAPEAALARAVELTLEIAGGQVASDVIDERAESYQPLRFPFRPSKVRDLIGLDISNAEQITILERLGFSVEGENDEYVVTVPYWRDHDIEAEIDFGEEIARMYGYHNMPGVLPDQAPPSYGEDQELRKEYWTKQLLASVGFTEFYGMSFASEKDFTMYGLHPDEAVAIHNPLSTDLTHLRTSLLPSLLRDIEANQGEVPEGRVFELARVYLPQKGDLPVERTELVFATFGMNDPEQAFRELKGVLELFGKKAGLAFDLQRLDADPHWHPSRTAGISYQGKQVGVIGQVSSMDQEAFGIHRPVFVCSLDFFAVVNDMKEARRYQEIPGFPSITRDASFVLPMTTPFVDVEKTVRHQSALIESVQLIETYQGEGIEAGKRSVTLSIAFRGPDRTLEGEEVGRIMKQVTDSLSKEFDAILR